MAPNQPESTANHDKDVLIEQLWSLGAFQFGEFSEGNTTRNSPIFINTKRIISKPSVLMSAARLIAAELEMLRTRRRQHLSGFDFITGIPFGGLHLATALSLYLDSPLLYVRPPRVPADLAEPPYLEGSYRPGQSALVIDDLAAGGSSLRETVAVLRSMGITVSDAIVLVDREAGVTRKMEQFGVRVHAVLKISYLARRLLEQNHITQELYKSIDKYLGKE